MKKIFLSGYMGSGKSTHANLLADQMGLKSIDLDQFIEKKYGLTIPEIFKTKGEVRFRKMEHEALKELVQSPESFILSLGGGTPCFQNNFELLEGESITTIYLKASIETLFNRLTASANERPLLTGKTDSELKEFIAKHLFERNGYYSRASHQVNTNGKSPDEVVSEILQILT